MPSILSDISDALHFLQSPKFEPSTGEKLDTSRIALSGSSAGGWLALLAGTGYGFEACGVKAPLLDSIRGIAAIYPITSLTDDFWLKRQHPVSFAPASRQVEEESTRGTKPPGIAALDLSPATAELALTGGNDKVVQVYNRQNGKVSSTLKGHTKKINAVAWTHNGEIKL
ncbi:hypothetical protein CF319_g9560, partial [Tilletia indica]